MAQVKAKTDKAVLVEYETVEAWIADSLIHDNSEIWKKSAIGDVGQLMIPLWLAEKVGFE